LGEGGAEKLSGNGAMLFKSPDQPEPVYLQGAFMPTKEIELLIGNIASKPHDFSRQFVVPEFDLLQHQARTNGNLGNEPSKSYGSKELANIIIWVLGRKKISALQIQQHFHIGNRAAAIVDELFKIGIVSEKFANQPRVVLPSCIEDLSAEVVDLLGRYGDTTKNIQNAFTSRDGSHHEDATANDALHSIAKLASNESEVINYE